MKHSIRTISASTLLNTLFIFGAAHEAPPKSIAEITVADLIGLSCSNRGNCGITTSLNKQQHNPSLSITLIYSEHPALQEPELLKHISQKLDSKKAFHDRKIFREACQDEVSKHIDPMNNNNETYYDSGFAFVALCVEIGPDQIRETRCLRRISEEFAPAGQTFFYPKKSFLRLTASGHAALTSGDPVEAPQQEAHKLQNDNPLKPFHLVVKLALWRHIAALRRKELKQERERSLDHGANALQPQSNHQ